MPEDKINNIATYPIVLVFLAALFIPFFGSLMNGDAAQSAAEKRTLAALPDAPSSIKTLRRYPEKFDLYFQDNFGFRNTFLWHNELRYWIGDSPSEKVTLGKNGWLFYNGEAFTDLQNAYRGIRRFSEAELKQYAEVLEARYRWLKKKGIHYLFVIAPNKHTIYREFLPDSMFQVNSKTLTDQFYEYMHQHTDAPVLDLRQALLDHKTSDSLLYYRTDTHWNHFGSNVAQYEIAKTVASFYPGQVKPVLYNKTDFRIKNGAGGDLSVMLGMQQDFMETHPNPILERCAKRPTPKDGNYTRTFTTQCGKSKLNAVIFRDSFFEYLYQFVSMYFNRATFISKRIEFSTLSDYVDNEKPDIVIEEWAERYLTSVPELEPEFVPVKEMKKDKRGKVKEER